MKALILSTATGGGHNTAAHAVLEALTERGVDVLLSVKPGVTGYWQAYARNNATYQSGHRQQMEMTYIRQASIWLDCKILMKTVVAVLHRDGAK